MIENAHFLERSELLLGKEKLDKLKTAHILVVGLGGVGSYAVEALARAGIGKLTLIDGDNVDLTNINRQLQALNSTIGLNKAKLMAERVLDINPDIKVTILNSFLTPESLPNALEKSYSYVLDCIDSITPKIGLIDYCRKYNIKSISSMGAGGKTNPKFIQIADISDTKNCNFSRDVRKRLKAIGIQYGIRVVYSSELMDINAMALTDGKNYKKSYYGTISYMPAIFGMTMASYVLRRLGGF